MFVSNFPHHLSSSLGKWSVVGRSLKPFLMLFVMIVYIIILVSTDFLRRLHYYSFKNLIKLLLNNIYMLSNYYYIIYVNFYNFYIGFSRFPNSRYVNSWYDSKTIVIQWIYYSTLLAHCTSLYDSGGVICCWNGCHIGILHCLRPSFPR